MSGVSARRMAERARLMEAIGRRPPWWRFFARRRWDRRRASIMAMDVSTFGEILANAYPAVRIEGLANRPNLLLRALTKDRR